MPFSRSNDPALCAGCGACAQTCPDGCITMQCDTEGFAYPVTDPTCCHQCGLCESACPAETAWTELHKTEPEPRLFAAWHLDDSVRQQSSSGGAFSALASSILKTNGVVFGAAFTRGLRLQHIAVTDEADIGRLRGSKYLQSSIETAYAEAKAALDMGKRVLFSGTPCQIAGLYGFLGGDRERLMTIDLLCHGVPSPKVFGRYLEYLQEENECKAVAVDCRDKRTGWRAFSMSVRMDNGIVISATLNQDPYLLGFLRNLYLRPACAICPYAATQRIGDITLGDFWGICRCFPELDDDKGISEVLINTSRGQALFDTCNGVLFALESPLEDGIQQVMQRPSVPSEQRVSFFSDFEQLRFKDIQDKYLRPEHASLASLLLSSAGRAKRILSGVFGSRFSFLA